jgi:hypothetical protein
MDFVLKKLRIKLIPTNTRFITYLMMGKVDHQLLEVTYQMARRRVHHQNFGQLRKSGSKITKMRQDNLPSTDNKYAAIVITQQTYGFHLEGDYDNHYTTDVMLDISFNFINT